MKSESEIEYQFSNSGQLDFTNSVVNGIDNDSPINAAFLIPGCVLTPGNPKALAVSEFKTGHHVRIRVGGLTTLTRQTKTSRNEN